jgi:hypothetical protein
MGCIGSSRQVLVCGGKQVVQSQLVTAAQRAPEACEGFLFSQELLCDGR